MSSCVVYGRLVWLYPAEAFYILLDYNFFVFKKKKLRKQSSNFLLHSLFSVLFGRSVLSFSLHPSATHFLSLSYEMNGLEKNQAEQEEGEKEDPAKNVHDVRQCLSAYYYALHR